MNKDIFIRASGLGHSLTKKEPSFWPYQSILYYGANASCKFLMYTGLYLYILEWQSMFFGIMPIVGHILSKRMLQLQSWSLPCRKWMQPLHVNFWENALNFCLSYKTIFWHLFPSVLRSSDGSSTPTLFSLSSSSLSLSSSKSSPFVLSSRSAQTISLSLMSSWSTSSSTTYSLILCDG